MNTEQCKQAMKSGTKVRYHVARVLESQPKAYLIGIIKKVSPSSNCTFVVTDLVGKSAYQIGDTICLGPHALELDTPAETKEITNMGYYGCSKVQIERDYQRRVLIATAYCDYGTELKKEFEWDDVVGAMLWLQREFTQLSM